MTQIIDCPPSQPRNEFTAVKARQQAMWSSGDFSVIGTTLQIVGEELCEAVDLRAGSTVLDVACGNGNASLAAARRFCAVTGLDYVRELMDRAAERARAERLDIRFVEGDAERLPFQAGSFQVVLSTFGVMFAPDQQTAANELVRVCEPGGTIGLCNWTPEGLVGRMLGVVSSYVPPPPGVVSPAKWGTEARLAELFEPGIASLRITKKEFVFRYRSAEHFIDVFRLYYGPIHKAFAALDVRGQQLLAEDMTRLLAEFNKSTDGTIACPGEYLEVAIEMR